MTIPADQLARWRALVEKATPGPWQVEWNDYPVGDIRRKPDGVTAGREDPAWEGDDYCPLRNIVTTDGGVYCYDKSGANEEFIAEARTALPLLLDEIERLQKVNEEMADSMGLLATGRIIREVGVQLPLKKGR